MIVLAILYWLYVATLIVVTVALLPSATRALTKRSQGRDFDYLLFWGLGFNRLWFLLHRGLFVSAPGEGFDGALLAACYAFAIALEIGVLRAFTWERADG